MVHLSDGEIIKPNDVNKHSKEQFKKFEQKKNDKGIVYYEAMQYRDRAMLSIFYGCGLRRNEAVHLDISDIIFGKSSLHVRKGKGYKERFVPVSKQSLQHLRDVLAVRSDLYAQRPLPRSGQHLFGFKKSADA